MKIIEISVKNKIASATEAALITCGNNDYKIKFLFDEEWKDQKEKVARFIFNGNYIDVNFSDDTCNGVIVSNARAVQIGVYAKNDESIKTTTPARIACRKSVLCDDIAGTQTKEVIITKGDKGDSAYEVAVENGFEGTVEEWLESLKNADPEAIEKSVTKYLDENPVNVSVTSVNGKKGVVELTAEDVGAISAEELQTAVDGALQQAKESGAFDGKDGVDGKDGAKGDAFTYEDFTAEQLAALKGKDGVDGKDGQDGADGKNGTSVTITNISSSTADGGSNIITFSDGKKLTVKNGSKGKDGVDGKDGKAFTYEDFTAEQLSALKGKDGVDGKDGADGKAFTYEDFTAEQLSALKGKDGVDGKDGEKGESFTYEDFTPEQLAALKGKDGVDGKDGQDGADGKAFTYEDFTAEQLAALKGKDGVDGKDGADGKDYVLTAADKNEIAEQAAALIDTSLAAAIGTGVLE